MCVWGRVGEGRPSIKDWTFWSLKRAFARKFIIKSHHLPRGYRQINKNNEFCPCLPSPLPQASVNCKTELIFSLSTEPFHLTIQFYNGRKHVSSRYTKHLPPTSSLGQKMERRKKQHDGRTKQRGKKT